MLCKRHAAAMCTVRGHLCGSKGTLGSPGCDNFGFLSRGERPPHGRKEQCPPHGRKEQSGEGLKTYGPAKSFGESATDSLFRAPFVQPEGYFVLSPFEGLGGTACGGCREPPLFFTASDPENRQDGVPDGGTAFARERYT